MNVVRVASTHSDDSLVEHDSTNPKTENVQHTPSTSPQQLQAVAINVFLRTIRLFFIATNMSARSSPGKTPITTRNDHDLRAARGVAWQQREVGLHKEPRRSVFSNHGVARRSGAEP